MAKSEKHCCPVCKQEYNTAEKARQCLKTNGIPDRPKFKKGQIVKIHDHYFKGQKAKIINFAYSQPDWLRKPAHKPTYLLVLPSQDGLLHLTTAWEEELTII